MCESARFYVFLSACLRSQVSNEKKTRIHIYKTKPSKGNANENITTKKYIKKHIEHRTNLFFIAHLRNESVEFAAIRTIILYIGTHAHTRAQTYLNFATDQMQPKNLGWK